MKSWLRLLLLLLTGSLAACSKVPNQALPLGPTVREIPIALYAAPAPQERKGLSIDEYVEWRMAQVRWVKAPTEEQLQILRESFRAEAVRLDRNGDGVLESWEIR